jgi:predicted TIM-barrel fold metal-dependent hydrolase
MIVDVHTRIWESSDQLGQAVSEQLRRRHREPWDRPTASITAHDQAMSPVQHAIILGLHSELLGARIDHATVAQYVRRDPVSYVGFAGIDPTAGGPLDSLDRAQELGLEGVVLSPAAQGFHPSDSRVMPLYEACEARGLPILVESGALFARQARMEFDQPYLLDEVARTFPELRLVLTSLGDPWIDQGLALTAKHPTVFADLSEIIRRPWPLYNALLRAHQRGVIEQIVFGSNFPFHTPERAIVNIYSVNTLIQGTHLPSVPREQLRSIIERNTLRCLGIREDRGHAMRSPGPHAAGHSPGSFERVVIKDISRSS